MNLASRLICLTLLCLASGGAAAEAVHKCKDTQGRMIYQSAPCAHSDVSVSTWSAQGAITLDTDDGAEAKAQRVLILRQQGSGHYFATGAINSKPLSFIVDTGASLVSLPRALAYQAGISCTQQVMMQTANGNASACVGNIARLRIGDFLMKDIPAMIVPNLAQPLLGMNVLQQFHIEQDNGEMRLSPKH